MAKDFDFIPAKRPPQKRTAQPAPSARPMPKKPLPPKQQPIRRTSQKPTQAHTTPKRTHQTRSSLIDYHPVQVPSRANKTTTLKPAMAGRTTAAAAHVAPPYLPPARTILTTEPEPKKRLNKKTIVSALVGFVVIVLLASGLLIPLLENPSVTIIVYVIAAIIFRLNSRVSFSIALLLLLAIPVLLLIRNGALASTYAVFCFYFLVVGVISATIELRKSDN